ncbi:dsRNA-binding domain-like protein, partial [Metschnikowia bicuspidata var. bicuspidata NRRL YB-4993]
VLFPSLSLFEETSDCESGPEPHFLSPWAKTKIGTFQARLELVLRKRELRGVGKYGISSVSSALLINMVNESFGFNGWLSQILDCHIASQNFDDEKNEYSMVQTATVRIVLDDGTEVEAKGNGEVRGLPSKYQCLGTSRKMACTDGLRNAFLKFPDLL